MPNQIEPSYPHEEQPERFYCRHCSGRMYRFVDGSFHSGFGDHVHEVERRLPENAATREEADEYLREVRG